jgi:hypothetical protein
MASAAADGWEWEHVLSAMLDEVVNVQPVARSIEDVSAVPPTC